MKSIVFGSVFILATTAMASAADITKIPGHLANGQPATFVQISGEIISGDAAKFKQIVDYLPRPFIILEGPGGVIDDGLAIGSLIYLRQLDTVVYKICASACGLIWLAGKHRFVAATGHIGFHAIRRSDTGAISSGGNAVVGAYLAQLGLSMTTIRYLTETDPDKMQWLDEQKAKDLGIKAYTLGDNRNVQ